MCLETKLIDADSSFKKTSTNYITITLKDRSKVFYFPMSNSWLHGENTGTGVDYILENIEPESYPDTLQKWLDRNYQLDTQHDTRWSCGMTDIAVSIDVVLEYECDIFTFAVHADGMRLCTVSSISQLKSILEALVKP